MEQPQEIILQDLLVGINAHINLDLGIAAAQVAPGDAIQSLKGDFDGARSPRSAATSAGAFPGEVRELLASQPPVPGV